MLVIWAIASFAQAKNCAKLDGEDKTMCRLEQRRAEIEDQIKDLGKCKQDRLAARGKCLQDRADLTQQVADLYAAETAAKAKPGKAKAVRSNSNRMEADVNEE